jgi:hypothetical protein
MSTQQLDLHQVLNKYIASHASTRNDGALRDGVLRAAAFGFACATGYNSIVAIRENVAGAPFGIRIPLPVSTGILIGWGSAIAAPWPMPAVALLAARRARRGGPARPALVCAGIGIAGIVGVLIEPNTYKTTSSTPAIRRAVVLHVATSATLAAAGIWHLQRRCRNIGAIGGVSR